MDTEDKKLIDCFLEGDELAFEKLLKKYLKPIYNFIHHLTRDVSASQDLTHETFVKSWKNLPSFEADKSFKTWIFTIAKHTVYDYCKKKKEIPLSFFEDEEGRNKLENISDSAMLPDELLNRENIAQEMEEKLKRIPRPYRLILNLRYKEDFSLLEIAEILKKPYNTIKSAHQRALKKLKELFL